MKFSTSLNLDDSRFSQTSLIVPPVLAELLKVFLFLLFPLILLYILNCYFHMVSLLHLNYIFDQILYVCWQLLASKLISVQLAQVLLGNWEDNMAYIPLVEGLIRHQIYCSLAMTALFYSSTITFLYF